MPKVDLVAEVRELARKLDLIEYGRRVDLPKIARASECLVRLADEVGRLRENIDGLDAMEAEVRRLREVLEKLARLGNEPEYGNSRGNKIARAAVEGTGGNQWQRRKS